MELNTGLVLSGGGARGAYQVGVLSGILEITQRIGIKQPFQILTGVSAGAVNTAYLAACADNLKKAAEQLTTFWRELHCDDIYKTDALSLGHIGLHLALDSISAGSLRGHHTRALLDTSPLAKLLEARIPFDAIRANINAKHLDAVCVSATNYATAECMSFYMTRHPKDEIKPWRRSRRIGVSKDITVNEVMASAAIPLLFPPVPIDHGHFGDGCLRNTAPLSPAIHLGADRLLIIGVRKASGIGSFGEDSILHTDNIIEPNLEPSIARVLNVVINAVLLDAVDADIERLARINRTVSLLEEKAKAETSLKAIDWLYFHPSVDIAKIAIEEASSMPKLIRYLMAGLGSLDEGADMISYLLFEPAFCERILALGYHDALARENDILKFFEQH